MGYRGAAAQAEPAVAQELQGAIPPDDSVMADGVELPPRMRQLITETAIALQIPPEELATLISFETGGTMDPMQPGPTTRWGQHRGLIQFGEPQAKQYGVDFSSPEAALESQLGKDGAIVKYALAHGYKPGEHRGVNLYATINAGDPMALGAKDEAAGGTPGTVEDKYYKQMAPHAKKFMSTDWMENWGGSDDKSPPAAAGEQTKTPEQKRLEGWKYFTDALSQPKYEKPVAPLTTGGATRNVAMMAIPEY